MDYMDELREIVNGDERTDRHLAKICGLPHTSIFRFRTGERGLPYQSLKKLATAVGYEIVLKKLRKR